MRTFPKSLLPLALAWSTPALAQAEPPADPPSRPIALDARYVMDVVDVAAGGEHHATDVLHNVDLVANADLARLVGWRGARAKVYVLGNNTSSINDAAGTLQGVSNIETYDGRFKLYEAWIEQSFAGGRAALQLGLVDLNCDFYQNESSASLRTPSFGVGSELSSTGPNGPSIFPSTALTARLNVAIGHSGYARAAVVNAHAGVLGDRGGVDISMRDGALLIGEAGTTRGGKLAIGFWRYTRPQDDIRLVDAAGDPLRHAAMGAYLLVDQRIAGDDTRSTHLFLRAGISEGKTTPFTGGVQVGAKLHGLLAVRPHGDLIVGYSHAKLSGRFLANLADEGERPQGSEDTFEFAYKDQLAPFLTVQPDLQYIHRGFDGDGNRHTLVLGVRVILAFERH